MATFQCIKAICQKSWKIQSRYKMETFSLIFRPLLAILPLVFFMDYIVGDNQAFMQYVGTKNYQLYIVCSMIFTNFIINTIGAAMVSITDELQQGTLETVLILPVNMELYWCTGLIFSMLLQLCAAAILLLTSCLLLHITFSVVHIGYFIAVLIVCMCLNIGIGMFLSGITLKTKLPKMAYLILSLLIFLAGETYPVAVFPLWLRALAYLNPITYLLDLIRYSVLGATTFLPAAIEMTIVVVLGASIFCLSILQYRAMIKKMKSAGNLTNY